MVDVVCCMLFVVCRVLSVVFGICSLCVARGFLLSLFVGVFVFFDAPCFVLCCWLLRNCCLLSVVVVKCLLFVVSCLTCVVRCLSCVVCRFVV